MVSFRRPDPLVAVVFSIWILTMIGTPIVGWIAGEATLRLMISIGVVVQTGVVVFVLLRGSGKWSAMGSALLILPLAWLVEFIGSTSGFPFGSYSYTEILQPHLGGVPLLIPLAWMMMLPPAWGIASRLVKSSAISPPHLVRLARGGVAAMAFTAWDLFLDPQMVAWDFWVWAKPGEYFGIPLMNFIGWFLVSFAFSYLLMPARLPIAPLVLIYIITWFLQSIGLLIFWGLPGPAVCGFFAMGGMILWAFLKRHK
jgi:putative membrane protein